MKTESLISIEQYCEHNSLEPSFIDALTEYGLIELIVIKESRFIPIDNLINVERLSRLHYELEINMEGIDAIAHLLQRIDQLQDEMWKLKERLNIYEGY